MEINAEMLPVCRANELKIQPPEKLWLIEPLWAQYAVGIIGGAPKCCKSWLGLDMALSVASATPCLGRFAVFWRTADDSHRALGPQRLDQPQPFGWLRLKLIGPAYRQHLSVYFHSILLAWAI